MKPSVKSQPLNWYIIVMASSGKLTTIGCPGHKHFSAKNNSVQVICKNITELRKSLFSVLCPVGVIKINLLHHRKQTQGRLEFSV